MGFQLFCLNIVVPWMCLDPLEEIKKTGDLCRIQTWTASCGSDWGDDKVIPDSPAVLVRRKVCIYFLDASYEPRMCELSAGNCGLESVNLMLQQRKGVCYYTNFGLTEQTGLNLYRMVILSTGLKHTQLTTTWSMCY